ncbi:protein N-terminal glutamine amidohydrolase-like [Phragmites australis]|uniref:protein N-terminal glutamine amidohydrolase-like n=1 Tax=Phragmites australis TaxID=29695 RepID=UPI002D78C312|nr:protein N-terminal glutamine amidohydrolase-like [Phragmites australis]
MANDLPAAGAGPSPVTPPPPSASPSAPPVDASSFTHTPFYCEENVYFLCKELIRIGVADPAGTDLYIVFISNEEMKVPLWHQKASHSDDVFVLWDYHVICIEVKRNKGEVLDLVWDLDSNLPFPSPFLQYVSGAIRPLSFGDSIYRRLFRVIQAPMFLRSFASDRSRMKDLKGNWIQLPPEYEPIVAEDGTTNNLNEYITMSMDDVADLESMVNDVHFNKHVVVVNEMILLDFFSRLPG